MIDEVMLALGACQLLFEPPDVEQHLLAFAAIRILLQVPIDEGVIDPGEPLSCLLQVHADGLSLTGDKVGAQELAELAINHFQAGIREGETRKQSIDCHCQRFLSHALGHAPTCVAAIVDVTALTLGRHEVLTLGAAKQAAIEIIVLGELLACSSGLHLLHRCKERRRYEWLMDAGIGLPRGAHFDDAAVEGVREEMLERMLGNWATCWGTEAQSAQFDDERTHRVLTSRIELEDPFDLRAHDRVDGLRFASTLVDVSERCTPG